MAKNKNTINIKNKSMNKSTIKSMCVSGTGPEGWHTHMGERN